MLKLIKPCVVSSTALQIIQSNQPVKASFRLTTPIEESIDEELEPIENPIYLGTNYKLYILNPSPQFKALKLIDIKEVKPTMMTGIIKLNAPIDIINIIRCLRVKTIPDEYLYNVKRIPVVNIKGFVIRAHSANLIRGYKIELKKTTAKTKHFENAVAVDISTGQKNVNIKIFKESFHISGLKNIEMGIEITKDLIKNAYSGQLILNKINKYGLLAWLTKKWLIATVRYQNEIDWAKVLFLEKMLEKYHELNEDLNLLFEYYNSTGDLTAVEAEEAEEDLTAEDREHFAACQVVNDISIRDIDLDILEFLLEHLIDNDDFTRINELTPLINTIYSLKSNTIIPENLSAVSINTVLANFNYPLGFSVCRRYLCQLIDHIKIPCYARFNPVYDSFVALYFPCYDTSQDDKNRCLYYSMLMVYANGRVTHTGRALEAGYEIRRLFLSVLHNYAHLIKID